MKARLLIAAAVLAVGTSQLRAATITVTSTADYGPGSLRDALASATDGDTIDASSVTGTILLTNGELLVSNSVDIIGPDPDLLAVNGNAATRVFHIGPNTVVNISSLTITNGAVLDGTGGGIYNDHATLTVSNCTVSGNAANSAFGAGGGIYNDGYSGSATLTIANSTLSGNSAKGAFGAGGGIYNDGFEGGNATLIVSNCTVSGNAANGGGGIYNNDSHDGTATLTIANSTVSSNAASDGGGIYNGGTLTIANSTLSGNSASDGGGILNGGTLTIANSTLSGNLAMQYGGGIFNIGIDSSGLLSILNSTVSGNSAGEEGGGIYNNGSYSGTAILTIVNSTLSGNSAAAGGGIYNEASPDYAYAPVEIGSSILNAGVSGGNILNAKYGTFNSLGYNLSSDDGSGLLNATGDQTNTNPMLGPLQDNGGPTFTCALLPGSPVINAGDPNFTPPPYFDQRGPGFPRVVCGRIDIGAFEVQDTPIITCPANIVTDATSPKGAVVYFAPPAVDECFSVSISSTPSSGSLFAIGDTTVTSTAVDGAGNEATCSFTVHVKGAAEQVNDLIALVQALNLKPWTTYILTTELQSASNALRRDCTRAACIDLDAFIFEVDAQTWWGQIWPPSRARLLIRNAQRIQNVLGCDNAFGPGHF